MKKKQSFLLRHTKKNLRVTIIYKYRSASVFVIVYRKLCYFQSTYPFIRSTHTA